MSAGQLARANLQPSTKQQAKPSPPAISELSAATPSEAFYTKLGFPEFAGKYESFDIPAGYTVKSVVEQPRAETGAYGIGKGDVGAAGLGRVTSLTLQIVFEPVAVPVEELSWSEKLARVGVTPLSSIIGLPSGDMSPEGITRAILKQKPLPTHPFLGVAAVMAPFEATVYSVARLVGQKTPSIPPTALSEAISGGITLATAGKLQATPEAQSLYKELGSKDFGTYMAGTLLGDYLLGMGISKVASVFTKPLTTFVKSRAANWLTQSWEESARANVLWQPSTTERLVMKLTGVTPRELPSSIIGLPTLVEEGSPELASNILDVSGLKGSLGLGAKEYRQLPSLIAGEDLLDFTQAARTVGYGLTEASVDTAREVSQAGVKALAKQALPYTIFQMGRQVSLAQPQGILGFEKYPYRIGYSTKLGFAKQRLPTVADLLKDTRGQMVLGSSPLAQVVFMLPEILPKLSIVPELAARGLSGISLADALGVAGVLGVSSVSQQRESVRQQLKVASASRLKGQAPSSPVADFILGQKSGQRSDQGQAQRYSQMQKQVQKQRAVLIPKGFNVRPPDVARSILGLPLLPSGTDSSGGKGTFSFGRRKKYRSSLWVYPFPSERELAKYILGRKQRRRKR
ncbi:MAG: hypothetical protein LAN71_17470 [Acidobacteriia bacterium]|nr:hypothetical protein [Terriglobia bacterium]